MLRSRVGLVALAILLFLSASNNPASDKPKAVTGEATTASSPAATGQKYTITPENSKIEFVGAKVTGSHNGSFKRFSGVIDYAGAPEKSHVTINIDTESLETDTPDLSKHLKTADFFDVSKFPTATFESTEIKPGGASGATHTVTGNLTMHGVTKSISFPATISASATGVTVESTFSINRKDFGINYAGAADNLIRDDVLMKLNVRATK